MSPTIGLDYWVNPYTFQTCQLLVFLSSNHCTDLVEIAHWKCIRILIFQFFKSPLFKFWQQDIIIYRNDFL